MMVYLNPTMNSAKVRTLYLVALCYSQGLAAFMSIELTDEQIRSVPARPPVAESADDRGPG